MNEKVRLSISQQILETEQAAINSARTEKTGSETAFKKATEQILALNQQLSNPLVSPTIYLENSYRAVKLPIPAIGGTEATG